MSMISRCSQPSVWITHLRLLSSELILFPSFISSHSHLFLFLGFFVPFELLAQVHIVERVVHRTIDTELGDLSGLLFLSCSLFLSFLSPCDQVQSQYTSNPSDKTGLTFCLSSPVPCRGPYFDFCSACGAPTREGDPYPSLFPGSLFFAYAFHRRGRCRRNSWNAAVRGHSPSPAADLHPFARAGHNHNLDLDYRSGRSRHAFLVSEILIFLPF